MKGNRLSELSGRSIIVAGGTSGIGLASAQRMSFLGASVTVTGRDEQRVAKVRQDNPGLRVEVADASSSIAMRALYESLERIDDLVLCVSGGKGAGPFSQIGIEDLREGFEQKFFAQFRAAQAALPFLRKDGSLTFVSAISARAANPDTAGLAAINGAIEAMVKPLARELRPLRVNAVSPGVVETPWWEKLPQDVRETLLQRSAAASLVGRNGSPEDLADAIVFVVANGFVNGTVLEVDGGLRLG